MNIKDSMAHSFGGFELDTDKIGNVSTEKYEVVLPYTGTLPACIAGVESAAVKIMVTAQLEYKAFLLIKVAGIKKPRSHRLEATTQEIESLLRTVIYEKRTDKHGATSYHLRRNNGLNGYMTGFIQAQFISRQEIVKHPELMPDEIITAILKNVNPSRLQEIIDKSHRNTAE